jgi:hypothetical protein
MLSLGSGGSFFVLLLELLFDVSDCIKSDFGLLLLLFSSLGLFLTDLVGINDSFLNFFGFN